MNENTLAVWRYLAAYVDEHGYSPSRREIAAACFIAKTQVRTHLDKLALLGHIEHSDGLARGIRLLHRPIRESEIAR